jgi:hypothetical protein
MQRDIDEAEQLLLKWADWMRAGGGNVRGYPRHAPGFQPSWIKDNEELVDAADSYEMGKINATIESLSQPHQRIIYKHHNLGFKVWRFPDEEGLYLAATVAFRRKYFAR